MNAILNADLHCHSVISDGTLTPEALAERARLLWPELRVLPIGGDDPAGALPAGYTADALARAVRARLDSA